MARKRKNSKQSKRAKRTQARQHRAALIKSVEAGTASSWERLELQMMRGKYPNIMAADYYWLAQMLLKE